MDIKCCIKCCCYLERLLLNCSKTPLILLSYLTRLYKTHLTSRLKQFMQMVIPPPSGWKCSEVKPNHWSDSHCPNKMSFWISVSEQENCLRNKLFSKSKTIGLHSLQRPKSTLNFCVCDEVKVHWWHTTKPSCPLTEFSCTINPFKIDFLKRSGNERSSVCKVWEAELF